MKKFLLPAVIFLAAFIISYAGLCYLVPGLRIKLAADGMTYLKEGIHHMIFFKCVISFIIGSVFASISFLVFKRK